LAALALAAGDVTLSAMIVIDQDIGRAPRFVLAIEAKQACFYDAHFAGAGGNRVLQLARHAIIGRATVRRIIDSDAIAGAAQLHARAATAIDVRGIHDQDTAANSEPRKREQGTREAMTRH
jgi:hypothetical protein